MVSLLSLIFVGSGGWQILKLLPLKLTVTEKMAASSILGIFFSTWTAFLLAFSFNYQAALLGVGVIWLSMGLTIQWKRRWWRLETMVEPIPPGWRGKLVYGVLILLGAWLIAFLDNHFLRIDPEGWFSAGYTWSDLALHLSLASHFAYLDKLSLEMPIFAHGNLSYPFLVDFFSGLLIKLGSTSQVAFFWPTLVLLLAFLRLSLGFATRVLKSAKAAALHLLLYLGSGSALGLWYYLQDASVKGVIAYMDFDYSQLATGTGNRLFPDLVFANSVTSSLLPQRSLLMGIGVVVLVFFFVVAKKPSLPAHRGYSLAGLSGLLIGGLPLIHVHSFLVVMGVLIIWLLLTLWQRAEWKLAVFTLGVGLLAALTQLLWQFQSSYNDHFGHFFTGWMTEEGQSIGVFWLRNLGLWLILLIPALIWVFRKKPSKEMVTITLAGLGIALIANLYIFQPNVWDNMKFFTYAYYFLSLPLAAWLITWHKKIWSRLLLWMVVLIMILPGGLAIARDAKLNYRVLTPTEVDLGEKLRQVLPQDAVVLTTSRHNHPIPLLTGRKIVLGYTGWLWSYGINYYPVEQDIAKIWLGGSPAWVLLKQYGVTHIVISDNEAIQNHFNLSYYLQTTHLIMHENGWWVFALN